MSEFGIYKITNTINNQIYIGSAIDIKDRWRCHKRDLLKYKHYNKKLQHAWNKYGKSTVARVAKGISWSSV